MARYYTLMTKEDFLKKIKSLMFTNNEGNENYDEDRDDDEFYPYNLPKAIRNDLSKVEFDFENFSEFNDMRPDVLEGYREIADGFHVFFAWAGGDCEFPVTWIFYNSDKGIRAYIPSDGNPWDKKNKSAYGGEYSEEGSKQDIIVNESKITADILKRIVIKR